MRIRKVVHARAEERKGRTKVSVGNFIVRSWLIVDEKARVECSWDGGLVGGFYSMGRGDFSAKIDYSMIMRFEGLC